MNESSALSFPRLVGDIGGTHARFAMVLRPDSAPVAAAIYRCNDFATLWDALQRYLAEHAPVRPLVGALGVATAVTGDQVCFTNLAWSFSRAELQEQLDVERLLVINDFSALALALPVLTADELQQVGGGTPKSGAPLGLIGPGTGLGVSGLLPTPDGFGQIAISGEGGHVTLSSFDNEAQPVLQWLHDHFGHVSAERVLSGPGLENLYQAICVLNYRRRPALSAQRIAEAALAASDKACVKALSLFCGLLGDVAGNLALTLGARGGIYIGGGIVPRLADWFVRSTFRERFESKGRFSEYLRAIPTYVVQSRISPALIGASRALDMPSN